jgi:porin
MKKFQSIFLLGLILFSKGTFSQEPQTQAIDEEEKIADLYITGDWGGGRQKMADKGVIFEVVLTNEFLKNTLGGLSSDYSTVGNLDVTLGMDLEKLLNWTGGEIFLYGLGGFRSLDPTAIVGDLQASSNIEAGMDYFKLYSAYISQGIFDNRLSLLIGLHDLNADFYANDPAGLFFNSSFGIGTEIAQSGANGPSIFPSTSLAARLKAEPFKDFFLLGGVFNAVSGDPEDPASSTYDFTFYEGILAIVEMSYYVEGDVKIALGGWMYSNPVPDITDSTREATGRGLYLLFDKTLEAVSFFIRAGFADPDAYEIEFNVAEGISLSGSLWNRNDDALGLGVTTVISSPAVQDSGRNIQETAIELTYLLQVTPSVSIQPDIQYVINPSLDPNVDDALVVSWRAVLSF